MPAHFFDTMPAMGVLTMKRRLAAAFGSAPAGAAPAHDRDGPSRAPARRASAKSPSARWPDGRHHPLHPDQRQWRQSPLHAAGRGYPSRSRRADRSGKLADVALGWPTPPPTTTPITGPSSASPSAAMPIAVASTRITIGGQSFDLAAPAGARRRPGAFGDAWRARWLRQPALDRLARAPPPMGRACVSP